jgi:protein-S-isoprenylcysteine O-methyltransferase Ste14
MSQRRIIVSRVFAGAFFALVLFAGSAHEGSVVEGLLFLLGVMLVGVATVGRLWCSLYISGYKKAELITMGPYSMTRNPLYFFSLLGFAGLGFATQTFTLGLVLIVMFAIVYPSTIRREEAVLGARFGEAFTDYCARTPRLFPNFRLFNEPDTYTVNPRLFRRTMGDVLWFVWLVGAIAFIDVLHENGVIVPLFQLP